MSSCSICRPPGLPPATFAKISFIPDPIPQVDGHYKLFEEVYGTVTTKEFRPSLSKRSAKSKKLPFSASAQHIRNEDLMVQCEECDMRCLLYSPRKLSPALRKQLSTLLEDYTYTCGATLSDLELPDALSSVCARDIQCYDPLENLYFSMKYEPICIHCCGDKSLRNKEGYYPQCELCADKTPIAKRV